MALIQILFRLSVMMHISTMCLCREIYASLFQKRISNVQTLHTTFALVSPGGD